MMVNALMHLYVVMAFVMMMKLLVIIHHGVIQVVVLMIADVIRKSLLVQIQVDQTTEFQTIHTIFVMDIQIVQMVLMKQIVLL